MREQRMQAVSELAESRFDWAHAFHELGRVLPVGRVDLLGTGAVGSGTSAGRPPVGSEPRRAARAARPSASATPPGSVPTFILSGCTTSQAEVAQTLNRLRLIDGVRAGDAAELHQAGTGAQAAVPPACPGERYRVRGARSPSPPSRRHPDGLGEHDRERLDDGGRISTTRRRASTGGGG